MANHGILIDFWDVGQGDCTVIHLPDDQLILVDVGPIGSPVVDWFVRQPHCRIHSIVVTHNDSDHAGALPSLLSCCRGRIGCVYVLADRSTKDPIFRDLFRRLDQAWKNKEIAALRRLEAPATLWTDDALDPATRSTGLRLEVRHPNLSGNVLSSTSNETSAVLVLHSPTTEAVVWAGDTTVRNLAAVASGTKPVYQMGPHHGAPTDRGEPDFLSNLKAVAPRTIIASVGTGNRYDHPCVKFIKQSRRAGASFTCTQLNLQCERPTRYRHVFKGAAFLGLPQAKKGYSCRGTIRLVFDGVSFRPHPMAQAQHIAAIKALSRPKCLRNY